MSFGCPVKEVQQRLQFASLTERTGKVTGAETTLRIRLRVGWLFAALALGTACSNMPERPLTPEVVALPAAADGLLADLVEDLGAELAQGQSAYWLVEDSEEALNTRLALLDSAVSSLDIQYFIWEPDPSGRFVFRRLLHAADRGVRIRLLMDDVTVSGRDHEFRALDGHPMIEVRLFNPWRARRPLLRVVEFMGRFGALNHRLHQKTVVADGRMALIGGRNIGDRYFGLYDDFVQNDLDILFAGPTIEPVIEDFDLYWNASEAYPVSGYLTRRRNEMSVAELVSFLDASVEEHRDHLATFALEPVDWTAWAEELRATYAAGTAEYYRDEPHVTERRPTQLDEQLREFLNRANEELIVSTAYLVPDQELIDQLAGLSARGVRVVVLTNSLQTNNHTFAHVAYKRWRRRLLEAGIELYELRPDADILADYAVPPAEPGFMGLHSKAAIVDGRWVFIGTPNIDPRSLVINTENGLAVDSGPLATELRALLLEATDLDNAWRVDFDDKQKLIWRGNPSALERQPANGFGQRIIEFLVNLLPLKKQA